MRSPRCNAEWPTDAPQHKCIDISGHIGPHCCHCGEHGERGKAYPGTERMNAEEK